MKRITLFVLAMILAIPGMVPEAKGQTKVFDQTITWTYTPYAYGGYGFYWWHRTDGQSIYNYGSMPSDNWYSPTDYYNGNFTMSVEVISQPTNEPFYVQFGIWGDYWKGSSHTETVAGRQRVSGGAGSSGSWGLGSPSGWWNKQPSDKLDFSRADDFYRIGVVLWDGDDVCIPMGHDWSSSGCPENAYKYFPMTIKISVYASAGSGPPPPPPPPPPTTDPPNYSIDYWGERTNKVISSEDQYSYSSDFSSVTDGNGQYLSLTPGTNVYFRKKSDYSKKQTLTVPYRPGTPTFGINYGSESTSTTVSEQYKYSSSSDMGSSSTGDGSYVSLSPGSNMYFRKSATSSAFYSEVQSLTVPYRPSTPDFGINYPNERTSSTVSSEYIYSSSSDMSSSSTGDGTHVSLSPGSNMYFRKKATGSAFASGTQTLAAPSRPAAPAFEIDYSSERTSTTVGSEYIHSSSSDMSSSSTGDGSYVSLSPGSNMYFRKVGTASVFASSTQTLAAPSRPAAPAFDIDYSNERTSATVGSEHIYSSSSDMSSSSTGDGSYVSLSPGSNMYFRKVASASAFASGTQTLSAPVRPAAPSFAIDYFSEQTSTTVGSEHIYSSNSDMSSSSTGNGSYVSLSPGSSMYFRSLATASAFASGTQTLAAPARPAAPSFQIDFMKEEISTAIGSGYSYSSNPDMSDATQGSDNVLLLSPGVNMYFQEMASASAFSSEIQMLESPTRSTAPSASIDYLNETSVESISAEIEYSGSAGFETAENGSGTVLDLMPGIPMYFRHAATLSSYSSEVYELQVPERPLVSSVESGSTALYPFLVDFTFYQEVALLNADDISVANADVKNLTLKNPGDSESIYEAQVFATANDRITIMVPANTVMDGNFISDLYEISYTGPLPGVGVESLSLSSFSVYPNPGKGVFHIKMDEFDASAAYRVEVSTITGKVAHTENIYGPDNISMDLSGFADGIYMMRLLKNDQLSGTIKLIIK